jgi:hypothetical protein
MIVTTLAPEFIFAIAPDRDDRALQQQRRLKPIAKSQGVTWTKAHTKFANMGGFVIVQRSQLDDAATGNAAVKSKCLPRQLSHFHLRQHTDTLEQISSEESRTKNPKDLNLTRPFHITAEQIIELCESKALDLPFIHEHTITDLAHTRSFAQAITALQILWVIFNIVSRFKKHVPIAQLELLVVQFALFSFFIHLAQSGCPKDVRHALTFKVIGNSTKDKILASALARYRGQDPVAGDPLPNYNHRDMSKGTYDIAFIVGGAASIVFLFAWIITFPNSGEELAWRYTSLYCITYGLIFAIIR